MATEEPREHEGDDDCPPPRDGDPNCNPKLINDLACKAKGVAAQAAYDTTYQADLAKARTDYDATRKDYRAKRLDGVLKVQDMRHQIRHLIERIKCLIEQRRVWRCLDEAFRRILEELRYCETDVGCCAEECEFRVDDCHTIPYLELLKRIANYQREVDEAKTCFAKLVAEPGELVKRVDGAKAAIDAINAALSADPAITDLKRVYAQALVANRDIERIWGGFDEIHDFVECLCQALTCWTKGCAAVSVLTGAKAVADCKEDAKKAHCDNLKKNTTDEILAMYDKLWAHHGVGEDNDESSSEGDENDSDHHEHHHDEHHHHHHH